MRPGDALQLHYELHVDGALFESTREGAPLELIQGQGQLPRAVDEALLGMRAGQFKEVELSAGAGFGPFLPEKKRVVPLSELGAKAEGLRAGDKLAGFLDGQPALGRVLSVSSRSAVVDFNHPLAGKALRYGVRVLRVGS